MERRLPRNAAHILRELGITRWQDVIFLGAMCVRNECIITDISVAATAERVADAARVC